MAPLDQQDGDRNTVSRNKVKRRRNPLMKAGRSRLAAGLCANELRSKGIEARAANPVLDLKSLFQ
jgi:hypothetical protein